MKKLKSKIKFSKVTCIISAYNEEPRIGNVLKIVSNHNLINQVIVIDDGSTDKTLEVVNKFKNVELIINKKNMGKTKSVLKGIGKSKNNIVILLDADLIGLTNIEVSNLILPVLNNKVSVSLSLRKNSLLIFKLIGLDFISGERVFDKHLLGDLNVFKKNLPSFGFESYMNSILIANKLKIKSVYLKNVSHTRKSKKQVFFRGTINDFKMIIQIIKTIGFIGIFKQNISMLSLKSK